MAIEEVEYKVWVTRAAVDHGFETEAKQNVVAQCAENGWFVTGDVEITNRENFKQADDYDDTKAMESTILNDWTYQLWTITGYAYQGDPVSNGEVPKLWVPGMPQ